MGKGINIEAEINSEDMQKLAEQGQRAIALAMKYTAEEVWANVAREAPTDHGRLAGSFQAEPVDDFSWRVYSNVSYALAVHDGRPPGDVSFSAIAQWANRKGLPPGPVFWTIREYGTEGNPYADRAVELVYPRAQEFAQRAVRETIGG